MENKTKSCHLGIALSGGSARGFAHIGVLQALSQNGIEPEIISGTSMGAVVGVFYAAGYEPKEIQEILTGKPVLKIMGFSWERKGVLQMEKLKDVLQEYLPKDDFSHLKKPFHLLLTDLNKGEKEVRTSGPLYEYILASCSAPVIFAPKIINGTHYVDGGLLCNLPASAIREKCKILIGSHVNYPGVEKSISGMKEILERAVNLGITQNAKPEMELCDYLVDPPAMQDYALLDFGKAEEIIHAGYKHTMEMITSGDLPVDQIKKVME